MWGDNSSPARLGLGQTADERALFLKVFGGEVLTYFTAATLMKGKTRERVIQSGKSAQFPLTGTAVAEYHTPGQEALGNTFATHEREISVDGLLISHYGLPDLDAAMSHFDLRGPIAQDMGAALARVYDQNAFRSVILAARTAAVGPFPGGNVITDAALTASGTINGAEWIDAIRQARLMAFGKNVPENAQWYMVVNGAVFDAIKYAQNAQGQYIVLNRDLNTGANGSFENRSESLLVEGVRVYRSNLLVNSNESAATGVYPKYRANYSTTTGIMFTPDAVGTVQLMGVSMETTRDVRRQEDFMIAKMAVGHGTLRPECAVEFRTAAPA